MDKKEPTPTTGKKGILPADPKKKKIVIGVSAFVLVLIAYEYYKNKNSSASSTASSSSPGNSTAIPTYISGGGGSVSSDFSGGGGAASTPSSPNPITNIFSPSITNTPSSPLSNVGYGGSVGTVAGATTPGKSPAQVQNKGGKTHLHVPVIKTKVHSSGGTHKISGATSTHKTVVHAPARRKVLPASHSGNFVKAAPVKRIPHNARRG